MTFTDIWVTLAGLALTLAVLAIAAVVYVP
jgi:hypothetical protein